MIDFNYSVALICCLLAYGLFKKLQRRRAFPLPPGPPGEPLIGHLRVYPRTHDTYLKWHKLYGDIVHLSVLGQPIIVLNTDQAANELLQKRGKIYSERPYMPMHDMIGWGEMLTFLNTGDSFNKARKLLQDPFTQPKCIMFQEMQLSLTHLLLKSMLTNPTEFNAHLKRFTTAVVVEIAYGHRILSDDDKHAEIIEAVEHVLEIGGDLGTSPVDLLPILRHLPSWLPGAWFIQYAKEANIVATALINNPFDEVLSKLANGTAPDCFTTSALETMKNDNQETDEDMRRLKNAAAALHSAGSDTTWGTLKTFVLLMVLYPYKQRKVQDELDTVLGGDRLPNFSDRGIRFILVKVIQRLASGGILLSPSAYHIGIPRMTYIVDFTYQRTQQSSQVHGVSQWMKLFTENLRTSPQNVSYRTPKVAMNPVQTQSSDTVGGDSSIHSSRRRN
ncbi:hypothetical protein NLI96_g9268 [Meripilus lineatus]|uniref:Cytochrome P450 n=1 Tax=Meripilus lineatus TaxID=2056292 RepID=A0AAD5UVS1_9APHY|nr:hypothetical protein NLI96_g9268 [Physisporinus lineatus]